MKVRELAEKLNLKVISGASGLENDITDGYTSDLLSDVIAHAEQGTIWITLQTHKNVMAIASLKDLAAIIIVNGNEPEVEMTDQSNLENIPVLVTDDPAFEITGKVYNTIYAYKNQD